MGYFLPSFFLDIDVFLSFLSTKQNTKDLNKNIYLLQELLIFFRIPTGFKNSLLPIYQGINNNNFFKLIISKIYNVKYIPNILKILRQDIILIFPYVLIFWIKDIKLA